MTQLKKQSRKKRSPMVVGVDIHPDIFSASLLAGKTNQEARVVKRFKDISILDLEAWARKYLMRGDFVLLEAGGNSFEAVRRFEALGLTVCVLESHQVSKTAEAYLDNDVIASERIARSYLTGMSKVVWVPDERTAERRDLLHAYNKAKEAETRAVNQLKGYLNQFHIRLERKNARIEKNQQWILDQRSWSPSQRQMLDHLFRVLNFAVEQAKDLSRMISQEVITDPMMCGCLRLLGIGPINAFAIVATVGDINRFSSPQKLVNYIGLNPGRKTSGKSIDKKKGIGNRGRKEMRTLLIQGAQAVMRQKKGANRLRDWGWRLFARKGNRNVAISAIARKMVIQLWHLLKEHTVTLEEQKKSLQIKLSKLLRELGKEWREANGLPKKTSESVAAIMAKIDQPLPQTI